TWDFIEAYQGPLTNAGSWHNIPTTNTPVARHENGFVEACGKFYLIGGRGVKPVQEYNPLDSTWTNKSSTPILIHHFQAVEMDGLIYIVGAFTNDFPNEVPIPNVYIYDPLNDAWTIGKEIPSGRRRGSAGAVVHNNKIYVVGGIVNGHISGTVDWFDVYDPYANTWDSLPSSPRIRDHIQVSIANNKMVVAGGRITSGTWPTVAETDIYDFTSNLWSSLPSPAGDIPTQRGGCCAVTIGDEVIIIGGESTAQSVAFNETEALDVNTLTWRTLDTLNVGRHGTQATVSNNGIYICAGSGNSGGGPELNSLEAFYMNTITQPDSNGTTESILVSTPSSVNFGQVLINNTQPSIINVSNTNGNQATIINSLSIIGDTEFTIDSTFGLPSIPFVLAPGQNFDVKINYNPTIIGVNTAMLTLGTTGASSPYNVSLSGEGVDTLTSLYRINSGGMAYTANTGELFVADNFFVGGNQFSPSYLDTVDILNTLDDVLYRSEHNDSAFSYVFPVSNGAYEVKLHFAEIFWGAPNGGAGGAGDRLFNVNIEGSPALLNYDIYASAGGAITAVIETFVINVTDGELNIDFAATKDNAKVSAIEVMGTSLTLSTWYQDNDSDSYGNANVFLVDSIQPAGYVADSTDCNDNNGAINPAATEVLDGVDNDCDGLIDEGLTTASRINAGGPDYNSTTGHLFKADDYFVGGTAFTNFALDTVDILNTVEDELYRSERTGVTFSYVFPVLDTSFLVKLHFADIFWGATNGGGSGVPGERVFDVIIEGDTVLKDFDIIAEVGGAETALVRDFNIVSTDGNLNIDFVASVDQAKVSAIEILPDSAGLICTVPFGLTASNIKSDSALIEWSPVTSSANFEVRMKESNASIWTSSVVSGSPNYSYQASGLTDITSYDVQVRSLCADTSDWSDTLTFITDSIMVTTNCVKPFNLSTENFTPRITKVYWDSTLTSEQWRIRYGRTGGTSKSTKTILAIPGDNSYRMNNLLLGEEYFVIVKSICTSGNSGWSDTTYFTTDSVYVSNCLRPTDLSTTNLSNVSTKLEWDDIAVADSWRIRYGKVVNVIKSTKTITAIPGDNSYVINNLSPNTDYYAFVRSICASGNSAWSDTIFFTTDSASAFNCIEPFNLNTVNLSSTSTQVLWDTTSTATSWRIRYGKVGNNSKSTKTITAVPGDNSYIMTGLSPNTNYYVFVRSICPATSSGWSDTTLFTTNSAPAPCPVPFNLSTTTISSNSTKVAWDTSLTAVSWKIRYGKIGSTSKSTKTITAVPGDNSYTMTGLATNTNYYVFVRSICAGSFSGWSDSTFFTTGSSFNCLIPTITSISNLSSTGADLGWSNASTAPQFEVRYTVSGAGSYTYDTTGSVYSYSISGLTPSTNYETAVRALCNPPSAWSGSITFTTNAMKISNNENSFGMPVTVYPNPTNGSINLIIESPVTKKGTITVSDLTGRVIKFSNSEFYNGNNYIEFHLSDVKDGLYFIEINVGTYSERVKIIKN
ncbi:MAG: T9SS type A sorting domain-containing protein, partial [Bacteroidia bacterium]|nr:T9SS type A sorting domain-containing protein [Bacteroidia bacterium]